MSEPSSADRWDEVYTRGTIDDALLYASIVWPDFVEREGMIFLASEVGAQPGLADVGATLGRLGGDLTEMERQFNIVEVPMLFASIGVGDPAKDEPALEAFATILRDAWEAKLVRDYPDRMFKVEVLTDEDDDPSVRFSTVRP